jgi:hypothetical protein
MEVSCQLHPTAVLLKGEIAHIIHLTGGWVSPIAGLVVLKKRRI